MDGELARPDDQGASLAYRQTYRRLLGSRLHEHCRVRAFVAVAIVVAASFANYGLAMELELGALCALAAFIALYNLGPWLVSRRVRDQYVEGPSYGRIVALSYGVVVLDFLALTFAIWLLGGCRSPLVAFYLLHVIVSAVLLSRRGALALTSLAYGLLILLVLGELSGVAPPRLPAGAIVAATPLEGRFAVAILVAYAMLFGMTCFLLLGLVRSLRSGEHRIHIANAELSRLSEQRRDFLHIAMHNLKAPLGAVTMFLENILAGLGGPVTGKQREWLDRSLDRLGGQAEFLSEMETLASLESTIIQSKFRSVDLAEVLQQLVDEHRDLARERGLELRLEIVRPVPNVVGHARLLREAAVNYITNAIKYTPRGGHVRVRLLHSEPHVRIEVSDDGEGIAAEDQERLFGEFVRLIKPGSRTAGVKGTGLGLSLVKRIVQAHEGRVGVESREGQGSTFFIELPPLFE